MKFVKFATFGLLAAVAIAAFAETVEDRIKPAGKTCMAGDDCAAAVQVADASAAAARSGEDIYPKCATCHATGAAGAPKLGDVAAWAPRIAQGMDVLYDHSINGFKGMPAKGLCFDCSDDEMKAVVDYMVENSK